MIFFEKGIVYYNYYAYSESQQGGFPIEFLYYKDKELIEYVEKIHLEEEKIRLEKEKIKLEEKKERLKIMKIEEEKRERLLLKELKEKYEN